MTRRILLATRSEGKLRELRSMLAARGWTVTDLRDAGVPETAAEDALEEYETFEENSLSKGRYFFALTGMVTIADDSGLAVTALGGRPGVRSKRWSERPDLSGQALDEANNRRLLAELRGHTDRSARYVCAAAFVDATRSLVRRGETEGRIVEVARGSGGFGYDPFFESAELGKTFGEATAAEKARVSHRARAVASLLDAIEGR